MEVVLSQFIKSLAASGLMTADEVDSFIDALPPDKKPEDGKTLAQLLVKQKKLTKFQAQAIFQGKTKGLIMGDYVVLDRIGEGGMGQVYKARHKVMKRIVALKTLPASATKLEAAVKRFHREVEVAARLSHPNIVTAHDAGEAHGTHYLVMELVEGDDLASHVRQGGRLPVQTAIEYTLQAARGLEYAHNHDVIHRDIKPSNLVLDKEGTVKVLDMGLARLNQAIGPDDSTGQQTLTGTGQAMGTIDYMPPEQAENVKEADERSDIYSLGCTLHYFLTGRSVYGGDTTVMRLLAHRDADIPSLRAERPEVPEHLDAVFAKMVAKKREDRFGSMTDVIVELQKCAEPKPDQFAETADLGNMPLSSAYAETQGLLKSDQTPGDESLMLGMPVVSPVETMRRRHPKKDNRVVFGAIIAAVCLLLLVSGVFIATRSDREEVASEERPVGVEEAGEESSAGRLGSRKGSGDTRNSPNSATSAGGMLPVSAASSDGNWALEFTGERSYVELPILYDGSTSISFDVWMTPAEAGGVQHLISNVEASGTTLSLGEDGNCQFLVHDGQTYRTVTSAVPPRVAEKTHLAGVFDGKQLRLYVNGQLHEETETQGSHKASILRFMVGANPYQTGVGGDECFHGIIDEVRISNIARYTEDFTPQRRFEPDKDTMALYHFDEGTGDVLRDSSGNGHDGKIVGATWVKVDEELGVVDARETRRSLIEGLDLQRNGIRGRWQLSESGILTVSYEKLALLEIPWEPLDTYSLELVVTPRSSTPEINLGLVAAGRQFMLVLHGLRAISGLDAIDARKYRENETACTNPILIEQQINTVRCDVGPDSVIVKCNGKEVISYHGDMSRLSLRDEWHVSNSSNLFIGAFGGKPFEVHKLDLIQTHSEIGEDLGGQFAQTEAGLGERIEDAGRASGTSASPTPPLAIAPFTPEEAKQHQHAWADYLGLPVEFENSIGMKMVLIPPGEFMMGSSEEEIEWALRECDKAELPHEENIKRFGSENPQHKVTITKPFCIAANEVTVQQFREFVQATGYSTEPETDGKGGGVWNSPQKRWEHRPDATWNKPGFEQSDEHPVTQVTWNDAVAFCEWLTEADKRTYRLPSEAQWELACRAGTTTRWCCGGNEEDLDDFAWYRAKGGHSTQPVGEKLPNGFGVFDMHGNAREWCLDWFDEDYYKVSATDDPEGPSSGRERVMRGDTWGDHCIFVRSACRYRQDPLYRSNGTGFRPVLLIDPDNPRKLPPQPPAESLKPEPAATSETKTEENEGEQTPKISWKLRHTLKGHTEEITSVVFHPTEMVIISASADGTLRFWNAESGEPTDVVEDWDGGSHCMAMSPSGAMVAFGGQSEGPVILALPEGRAGDRTPVAEDTYVLSVAFSPDGSTLAWGQGSGRNIGFYNMQTQQSAQWHHGSDNAVSALAYSPKGTYLASGSKNGSLRLWNVATGEPHLHLAGHDAAIVTVAFSPDGTILATGGHDKKLKLWDVHSGAIHSEIADNPIMALCFSPTLPVYAYGGHEKHSAIIMRHTDSSEVVTTLTGHGGTIRSLAFSPDGKLLASGCHDKTVRIWEIEMDE